MTQAIEVEVVPVPDSKIVALIDESGVEQSTAIALRQSFQPIADLLAQPLAEAVVEELRAKVLAIAKWITHRAENI